MQSSHDYYSLLQRRNAGLFRWDSFKPNQVQTSCLQMNDKRYHSPFLDMAQPQAESATLLANFVGE
jgi:hypothetical protein